MRAHVLKEERVVLQRRTILSMESVFEVINSFISA